MRASEMRKRNSYRVRVAFAMIVLILGVGTVLYADVPLREEQFIYSIVSFNGRDYGGTFVRQDSGTFYLMAGTDNFVSARKTLVYYWPITANYRVDTQTLNHQFDGTLHIRGNGVDIRLRQEQYTYYNLRGTYELNWEVAKGQEAEKVFQDYQKMVTDYQNGLLEYQKELSDYQDSMNSLGAQIIRLSNQGKDVAKLVEQLKALKQPREPAQASSKYAMPPTRLQHAFIVNLKPGLYKVEFLNPDGSTMEGSEKQLIVFAEHAANRVGYDVIPGDKWTRPESSTMPGSVLYIDGSTDLYLRPFFETEYNDLYYEKLLSNDARGNPNATQWVKLQQVPAARIAVTGAGKTESVTEEDFRVQQLQGATLGYQIVPYVQSTTDPYAKPDLIAYRIPIASGETVVHIAGRASDGAPLPGSRRQIRVIAAPGPESLLVVLALLPLMIMAIALRARSRRYSK
ncbi:MAG TPA: hypothetical protein VMW73_16000 [Spirochaetia bacterium]|nr:hypothetical protein [Spirochaetia bacterium]